MEPSRWLGVLWSRAGERGPEVRLGAEGGLVVAVAGKGPRWQVRFQAAVVGTGALQAAKALSWDSRVACSKDHLRATV